MTTVRELVTSWGFDVDDKPLKKLENTLGVLKKAVVALVTIETGRKLLEIVTATGEWGEQAERTAQKIGMQTGALQELQYAAKIADVENGDLTFGLKNLSSNLYDASNGSAEATKKFKALGIGFKNQDGSLKSADQMLMSISDKFSTMPDGVKKTALSVDLFGRSGVNMIPLLNKGGDAIRGMAAEAREFGLVMDEAAIKQSTEFMDSMKRAKSVLIGFRNEIGISLMPAITNLLKKFMEWARVNRAAIGKNIVMFFSELARYVRYVGKAISFLVDVGKRLIESTIGYEKFTRVVAGGFAIIGGAALAMQLQFLAIPAAITAALMAVYIIVDDFASFFQGKDSLIGRALTEIRHNFPRAFGFVFDVFNNLFVQFDILVKTLQTIFKWLGMLDGAVTRFLRPMVDLLNLALDGWKRLFALIPGLGGAALQYTAGGIKGGPLGTDTLEGLDAFMTRTAAPAAPATPNRDILRRTEIKPNLNITVNGGMTNEQTGGIVADAVTKVFEGMLKESSMDFATAIER